jgi:hypothetical protein
MTQTTITRATISCPRCSGTGERSGGQCFLCLGSCTVERLDNTNRVDPKIGERRYRLILAMRDRAVELDDRPNGPLALESSWGRDLLESIEPERHARALTSIEQGRVDDVIRALAAYYHQVVDRFPTGTLVSWTISSTSDEGEAPESVTLNGVVDIFSGVVDGEPNFIVTRHGLAHYVPASQLQLI